MKTNIAIIIALFMMSGSISAQIDRSKQPTPGPAPTINLGTPGEFELSNGLKVLVVENHKLPRISYTLRMDNPPVFEGEKAGMSSLLGAMLGNGTTSIPKDTFNEEIDFLGAQLNFGSSSAFASSLSKYSERILELMADATMNPLLTEEEFQKEKDKLIESLKAGEKDVSAISSRVGNALSYGVDHAYGEFLSNETVNNVALSDVKEFYKNYFMPNNAYLVIVGDIKFKTAKKLVKKHFKEWEKGQNIIPYVQDEKSNVTATEINFIDVPNAVQSNISLTNNIDLEMKDPDYHSVLIANKILGGGFNSYLNMNLREEHGYTYGARSSLGSDKYASRFKAGASVRNAVTDSAVVQTLKEVNRIKNEDVSGEVLANAKAKYVGDFVLALENPQTIAKYALNIRINNLPENFYSTYLEKINEVTIGDVKRVANEYFKPGNARFIVVGKANEILENLEKTNIPIKYFDKYANPTEKPDLGSGIPDGVTVKSVLQNYIEAIGGSNKINAVTSVLTNYEGTSPMGTIGQVEKRIADKYAQTTLVNGNPMMGVVATNSEMFMKQGANKMPLPASFVDDIKNTMGTFYEIAIMENSKATLSGIEKVDGKDAYKIEMSGTSMSGATYYDIETGLKVKETSFINMGGQTQSSEVLYSDYKEIDGILFANKKSTSFGPQVVEMTLKEALINRGISENDFK